MGMGEAGLATMASRTEGMTKYWLGEVRGELEGEQGGTCHNDKPGQMMGMIMEVAERSR